MEPQIVGARNVGKLSERIDRASHDRSRRSDHRDPAPTRVRIGLDRRLQSVDVDPQMLVHRDLPQARATEPEQRKSLWDRHVDLI
jgi:hypothetical protein